MLISAFFCRIYIPVNMNSLLFDRLLVYSKEIHSLCCHADNLFIFDEYHVPGIP